MNNVIIRVSNNIGNQMFMYAAAYSLSKILNRNLFAMASFLKIIGNWFRVALHSSRIESIVGLSRIGICFGIVLWLIISTDNESKW